MVSASAAANSVTTASAYFQGSALKCFEGIQNVPILCLQKTNRTAHLLNYSYNLSS